jgi:hypothetical protein
MLRTDDVCLAWHTSYASGGIYVVIAAMWLFNCLLMQFGAFLDATRGYPSKYDWIPGRHYMRPFFKNYVHRMALYEGVLTVFFLILIVLTFMVLLVEDTPRKITAYGCGNNNAVAIWFITLSIIILFGFHIVCTWWCTSSMFYDVAELVSGDVGGGGTYSREYSREMTTGPLSRARGIEPRQGHVVAMMGADGHVRLVRTGADERDRRQSVSMSQWNVPHSAVYNDRASGTIVVPIVSSLNDVAAVGADAGASFASEPTTHSSVSSTRAAMLQG